MPFFALFIISEIMTTKKNQLLNEFEAKSYSDWVDLAEKTLKSKKIETLFRKNYDGIIIEPYYSEDHKEVIPGQSDNQPGQYPYLRGYSTKIGNNQFKINQIIPEFRPELFNKRLKKLLATGQNSIYLKILPASTNAEKYRHGVIINSINDFEKIFKDIDLSLYNLYLEYEHASYYAIDLFEKYLNSKDYESEKLSIYYYFDSIAQLLESGKCDYNVFDFTDCIFRTTENFKHINTKRIHLNGEIYARKGASSVQEIALTLAEALAYISHYIEFDYEIDEILTNIHFTITIGNDFFFEIAKIRALRAVWAFIVKELGGNEKNTKVNLRLVPSLINKSPLDKETNILRITSETASAILAGCDTLSVYPYNYPFEVTDDFNLRITKNIQLVLLNETDLLYSYDAAGGAWYIESLTKEIIEKTKELLSQIEKTGGIIKALEEGFVQNLIGETISKRLNNIAIRKETLVGVNKYPNSNENLQNNSIEKLRKELRDYTKANYIKIGPPHYDEMPLSIEAMEDYMPAKLFYDLRKRAENLENELNKKISVFIAAMGTIKEHKARVDFIRDFLVVGGFKIEVNEKGYTSINDAVKDWKKSKAEIFAVCSSDEIYKKIINELVNDFKTVRPGSIAILSGYPEEKAEKYKQAGIDYFIHNKANIIETINNLLENIK